MKQFPALEHFDAWVPCSGDPRCRAKALESWLRGNVYVCRPCKRREKVPDPA